jgi:hypothetical protein
MLPIPLGYALNSPVVLRSCWFAGTDGLSLASWPIGMDIDGERTKRCVHQSVTIPRHAHPLFLLGQRTSKSESRGRVSCTKEAKRRILQADNGIASDFVFLIL